MTNITMDIMDEDDFKFTVVDLTQEEEQKIDDDLDYALSYCLQTEFEEESLLNNASGKQSFSEFKDSSALDNTSRRLNTNFKANKGPDADYLLALQLQTQFAEENGANGGPHSSSSGKPLPQNEKRFKASTEQDADYILAMQLQNEFIEENGLSKSPHSILNGEPKFSNKNAQLVKSKGRKQPSSIVDPEWEVLDPIPDIHSLFLQFNSEYFGGRLEGVVVRWSPRMTLCAGVCCYEGRGGLCSVRLSQPLLKYRPRRDLVETLLHEMIHAYLFVTHNNRDHDAHGPEFLKHMNRINQQTGTRISVYHSFHDEVDLHRKHWWKCNGPCQRHSPFFGLVKRAMNRAPSPRDPWWAQHQATCGGTFIKIKEPENSAQKKNLKRKSVEAADGKPGHGDIRNFFAGSSTTNKVDQNHSSTGSLVRQPGIPNIHTMSSPDSKIDRSSATSGVVPFSGKGYMLGSSVSNGSNNHSKLLESKVTKVPPVGNGFPSQRKETKNTSSHMPRKPAVGHEPKGKHTGSLKTLASGGKGTALKFSSSSGSRTVVIPKHQKKILSPTKEIVKPNTLPRIAFKGEGCVLGSGPRTIEEKESKFPRGVVFPSTSKIQERNSGDLPDNSFNNIFPKAPNKKDNVKSEKGNAFQKKHVSASQSEINLQRVSPSRKNSDTIKHESDSAVHSNASSSVKCPVCGSVVKDFAINAHLDTCLKNSS